MNHIKDLLHTPKTPHNAPEQAKSGWKAARERIETLHKAKDPKFEWEYPQFKKKASEWFPRTFNKKPQWPRLFSFIETSDAPMETLWDALEQCQERGKGNVEYFIAIVKDKS